MLIGLVSEDANEDIAAQLQLDGESLSPVGLNTVPGTPLERLAHATGRPSRQAVQCWLLPEAQLE